MAPDLSRAKEWPCSRRYVTSKGSESTVASSFWYSGVGREIRWRQRWFRTRRLCLDGEPERKRKGGRGGAAVRAVETQRKLVEQLKPFGHGVLTGPVALDLDFQVRSVNSPALYHLAKYLLDVLGRVSPEGDDLCRRHVLYRDDEQVKLLYVHLWHPRTTGASVSDTIQLGTRIDARPLRDVVADFELTKDLQSGGLDDDEDSPFYLPEIPYTEPNLAFIPEQAASTEEAAQWSNLNNWFAAFDRSRRQEALLTRTDALLASILCRSGAQIAGARARRFPYADHPDFRSVSAILDEMLARDRQMLLSEPMTFPMPGLPHISGEGGQTFKDAVRRQLEQLRTRWPVFNPLLVPLKVTFLVVTPEQGKDPDNIALEVLPLVHETLRPSPNPSILQGRPVDNDRPETQDACKRLHALRTHSVTAYEVIKLKRNEDDPPHGHLRLALGSGSQIGSTWKRIADHAEKAMRS
jgi:hypothetical protein